MNLFHTFAAHCIPGREQLSMSERIIVHLLQNNLCEGITS
jgi:hypothetical protein